MANQSITAEMLIKSGRSIVGTYEYRGYQIVVDATGLVLIKAPLGTTAGRAKSIASARATVDEYLASPQPWLR